MNNFFISHQSIPSIPLQARARRRSDHLGCRPRRSFSVWVGCPSKACLVGSHPRSISHIWCLLHFFHLHRGCPLNKLCPSGRIVADFAFQHDWIDAPLNVGSHWSGSKGQDYSVKWSILVVVKVQMLLKCYTNPLGTEDDTRSFVRA